MLLAKRRLSIIILGLIAVVALLFLMVGKADAADSVGDVTEASRLDFEEGKAIGSGTGWNWTSDGGVMKVAVFLDAALNNIHEIEVFVQPTGTNTKPVFSQRPTAGGAFPTGVNFGFSLTVPATREITGQSTLVDASTILPLVPGTTIVGIHLVDGNDSDVARSAAPVNTNLVDLSAVAISAPTTEAATIAPPMPTATATPSPTPASSPTLPPTGDVTPGSGIPLVAMLMGLFLIVAGAVFLARPRGSRA